MSNCYFVKYDHHYLKKTVKTAILRDLLWYVLDLFLKQTFLGGKGSKKGVKNYGISILKFCFSKV